MYLSSLLPVNTFFITIYEINKSTTIFTTIIMNGDSILKILIVRLLERTRKKTFKRYNCKEYFPNPISQFLIVCPHKTEKK